jgi:hypothetical protein
VTAQIVGWVNVTRRKNHRVAASGYLLFIVIAFSPARAGLSFFALPQLCRPKMGASTLDGKLLSIMLQREVCRLLDANKHTSSHSLSWARPTFQ